jgi:hypothetical protein
MVAVILAKRCKELREETRALVTGRLDQMLSGYFKLER